LGDGRRVRIVPRAGKPPELIAHEAGGARVADTEDVRRALRAEYGLNLVRELGHVPAARETLACLTRSSWTAIRLAQGALLTGRPVFLRGPTGCGKSALARTLARLWELPIVEFSFTGETSKSDLTATRRLRGGATEWSEQAFLEAAARGLLVIVNEYNLAYPDVHSIVNGLFDKGGHLLLPDGREVRAHPDFRLVATGYPEGPGVKPLNEGVENRFGAVIRMTYPPQEEELAIVNFVAEDRLQSTTLASAVEIATISRQILDGAWDAELRHPLSKVPADLAASVAERTALTTAELVALARASGSTEEFIAWYRRGVIEGAAPEVERVLGAALTAYGLA
jgi:MoxR-like ATPase